MITLQALYNSFAGHKEGGWILRPDSARALFDFLKTSKVKKVLELGTGVGLGTAVIALALENRGGEYSIDTVEQFDKCVRLAQEMMPEELRKNVRFHKGEVMLWETPDIPAQYFSIFKELPAGDYDFIVIDGPGPWLLADKLIEAPNADILKLHGEGKIKPGTIVYFDGRLQALNLLNRFYGGNFWLLNEESKQSNFIERKDNPVKFDDSKKGTMEQWGYFAA